MKLPKHWKDVTIGDCCSIRHGYAFEGPDMSAQATDGPIVVSIGNFQYTGGFRFGATTLKRATVDPPKDYVLRPGDVLVAMTCQTPDGEILGIPGMIPDDGRTYLHNQRLGLVVSKKEVPTSKPFLFYIFCSQPFNRHLVERATGTKVKHTSPTTIESFEFALPPLPEQRKIADILTTWDEALTQLDALIEAQERRKKALMQRLLSRSSAHFKTSHAQHCLGDVMERVTRRNTVGSKNVLTISAQGGLVNQQEYFNRSVAAEDLSGYYLLRQGEFAYNRSSAKGYPFGAIKRLDNYDQGVVSTLYLCFRLRDGAQASSAYLCHYFEGGYLNSGLRMIAKEGARAHGLLNVTADEFFDLDIFLPALPEQQKIAEILDTADQQLTLLRTQRTALDQQKRGLMQRLLTGKLRVVPNVA
jgi:type I restriction enzyme S subunit